MVSPCTLSLRSARRPRVHVDDVLGQGGQATVYAARWDNGLGFQRSIALKVALPDTQSELLLEREAHIAASLDHRHIVPVDDLVRIEGSLALVMSRIDGPDLRVVARSAARRRDRSIRAVLEVGRGIAAALAYLRDLRHPTFSGPVTVVHRDVKPSNILVDSSGGARLADFGVAVVLGQTTPCADRIAGTRGYIAPELVRGAAPSSASDVYALGATMLELLLLRRLHPRAQAMEGSSEADLRTAIAELPYRTAPVVMGRTAQLLIAMLDSDPARRPDASVLADAFAQLARLAPGRALLDWCARAKPPLKRPALLAWVGRSLSVSDRPSTVSEPAPAESRWVALGGAAVDRPRPCIVLPQRGRMNEEFDTCRTIENGPMFNLPPVPPVALPVWAVA